MVHFIGAILISITSQQHFPTIRNPKYCICQNYSRRKILSWSTTWHILKNSVWFEHSKCTHIDRCSRRLFPSPANREHTQKCLLQAWRSETNTALSAAFRAPFVTVPFPLFWLQRKTMTEDKR